MLIDTRTLPKDERTYLELGALYERNGYALYKMKKFEEYSLYVDNRNFLGSESVLTFQGFGGKLMALKPDVTLSIVKNARVPEDRPLRLYYRESVYRTERGGTDFKEINQMGLECIGALDGEDVRGICAIAAESLSVIDPDFIFSVSHMGYISALLDECGVRDAAAKKKVTDCIRSRNAHDLASAAGEGADTEKIARILRAGTEFSSALEILRAASAGEGTRAAADELAALYESFADAPYRDRIRLDLSIVNDVDYYTGIIFQGYVARVPKMILSGGRYDGLLSRIGRTHNAMGFALNLGELNVYYPRGKEEA